MFTSPSAFPFPFLSLLEALTLRRNVHVMEAVVVHA